MARRPWMVDDPDGRGWFELAGPRAEAQADYEARVPEAVHNEVLHDLLEGRQVAERAAVEDIDRSAATLGAAIDNQRHQLFPAGDEYARQQVEWARERLDAAKHRGRGVLADWQGWSGDQQTDRLIAHSREILSRAVHDRSDAADELERADAVARWRTDDEVALSDADGVLDGWQW